MQNLHTLLKYQQKLQGVGLLFTFTCKLNSNSLRSECLNAVSLALGRVSTYKNAALAISPDFLIDISETLADNRVSTIFRY